MSPDATSRSPEARDARVSSVDALGKGKTQAGDAPGLPVKRAVPRYDVNPKPPYPEVARRRGYEGTVLVAVRVLPDGSADRVRISRSSGYRVLDRAALDAVGGWRFIPGKRGDEPVEMEVQVPLTFRLR